MCECACVGTLLLCNSDAFCYSEGCTVCLTALNFNTHSAGSCQAITESLLSGCAFGKTRQCFSFFPFCFFVWSENDIIKCEWEIWSVPPCSMSARSRWCGKDNPSPDRGTQLGCWGPDGLLTTGNHSQHADTLTSTQMGYQNYQEHLGCCDGTLPCQSLGLFLLSLTPVLCSRSSDLWQDAQMWIFTSIALKVRLFYSFCSEVWNFIL